MRDAPTARWHVVPDLELLRSKPALERRRAVATLGRVGDERAVEFLSACLLDPDVDVTHDAAKMLAQVGTDGAIAGLLAVASNDASPVVRRVVATVALADVAAISERAVIALRALAADRDPWLVSAAKHALVRLMRY